MKANTTNAPAVEAEVSINEMMINGTRTVVEVLAEVECFVTTVGAAVPSMYGKARAKQKAELLALLSK